MTTVDLLAAAHAPVLALADRLVKDRDEASGWAPTRLPGWTVRDLLFHLASDSQRLLVALASAAPGRPDTDEVSYWRPWRPGRPRPRPGCAAPG